jgi:arylsulfatase A-like enzyme
MPDKFDIEPTVKGRGGIFPTIFGVLREQEPTALIAVFHDWKGFGRLIEPGVPDVLENPKGEKETMARAVEFLAGKKPRLLFIHLDHVDHAGHKQGHMSPAYLAAVEEADRLTGLLVAALEKNGMLAGTLLLVTADHGGFGTKHGQDRMSDLEIPWILGGPGVAKGQEIRSPVNTYDTAVTIAWALGLKPPGAWIGKVVAEAFARGR